MTRHVWVGFLLVVVLTLPACGRPHHGGGYAHRGGGETGVERGMKATEELVDKTVKDPAKASNVKALVREIMQEATRSYRERREAHRKLYELNANYNAAPEDFLAILDESNNSRMRSASRILALRFQIKDLLTPDEWRTLTQEMKRYGRRYEDGKDSY